MWDARRGCRCSWTRPVGCSTESNHTVIKRKPCSPRVLPPVLYFKRYAAPYLPVPTDGLSLPLPLSCSIWLADARRACTHSTTPQDAGITAPTTSLNILYRTQGPSPRGTAGAAVRE